MMQLLTHAMMGTVWWAGAVVSVRPMEHGLGMSLCASVSQICGLGMSLCASVSQICGLGMSLCANVSQFVVWE